MKRPGNFSVLILLVALAVGCGRQTSPAAQAAATTDPPVRLSYPVSPRGGTPATGPDRYNQCERIWCLEHGENFFVDHYATKHNGWILHDDLHGDVFVPRWRKSGPEFPWAGRSVLRLCGWHAHPHVLGKPGGPIKAGGFSRALGFNRAHYNAYGTRLDPCCVSALGWSFIHSSAGILFRFPSREEMASLPGDGWQKPFPAKTRAAPSGPG